MRFIFIDRVLAFDPGKRIEACLAIPRTLPFPAGRPDRSGPSPSLLLEALAQTGGWLIKVTHEFRVLAIMSVIDRFRFERPIPAHGEVRMVARISTQSDQLVGIEGEMMLPGGEVFARVRNILYVLIRAEGEEVAWSKTAWNVLTSDRRLRRVEEGA